MSVKERIEDLVNYYAMGNKTAFADLTGVTKQEVSLYTNRKTPSKNFLDKVLTALPNVNKNWLWRGEGEMLINDLPNTNILKTKTTTMTSTKTFEHLFNMIMDLEHRVASLEKALNTSKKKSGPIIKYLDAEIRTIAKNG